MKNVNILKKLGEKAATVSIDPRCYPKIAYQPKPPAKIQAAMKNAK